MSLFVEYEGKSVEDAVETASKSLNIPKDKIKYDVISYGSTGIFGLVGTKKAKIRVFKSRKKFKDSDDRKEPRQPDNLPDAKNDSKENIEQKEKDVQKKNNVHIPAEEAHDVDPPGNDVTLNKYKSSDSVAFDEAVENGKNILEIITESISSDAQIDTLIESGKICFNISDENPALMIGKKGQTLEAIQYLIEKIINKKSSERIKVIIDIEGYLKNKRKNLKRLSSRLADKAKKIGKPVTIGHMNSQDRKIVHMHLKGESGIRTQSVGDGYLRKLVIFPKRHKKGRSPLK